ncbi:MAG: A/G-specific adenine glycosylase [Flavobacteriales bacterium]|nr:MAG: A/G-specific adenine glycosylase [Flavobacteriales bacterium]
MGFSEKIIMWYHHNKRDLPWRKTVDPYQIWLSEIILQQTRVNQGLNYFNKFIEKHPTVNSLAQSSEKDILNLWQGLGYYSRARNLHFTAKYISNELNGKFPTEYKDILNLKGVGEYTAAAISSFSYNQSYPVIDGNVYRVLSRIFGIENPIDSNEGKKIFKKLANELIDDKNPSTYNQAIMEFGALQCTPKKPNCESCPYRLECFAYTNDVIAELPKKEKKIKQRTRYFNYLVVIHDDSIYLNERTKKDIWKGLFDFPLLETKTRLVSFGVINKEFKNLELTLKQQSTEYKHILSHQKIYATFWFTTSNNSQKLKENFIKVSIKEINNYPVPKLIENYLNSIL